MHLRPLLTRAASAVAMAASLIVLIMSSGCWRTDPLPAEDPNRPKVELRSSAFTEGGMIPGTFTCDGSDTSPPLEWSGVPKSARSLTLICDDPDAPMGTWSHWVVVNLPPEAKALKKAVPPEQTISPAFVEGLESSDETVVPTTQGQNDFGKLGYGGPCPPSGTHRYFFRLYALDTRLDLPSKATRADVLKAVAGHILAEGRLIGKYARSRPK
jgi:Raf kinase inhibitor-like YbhB/YbcL family protein